MRFTGNGVANNLKQILAIRPLQVTGRRVWVLSRGLRPGKGIEHGMNEVVLTTWEDCHGVVQARLTVMQRQLPG